MNPKEILESFLLKNDKRPHMNQICQVGEYAYATDGKILIRHKSNIGAVEPNFPDISVVPHGHTPDETWQRIDIVSVDEALSGRECKSCTSEKEKVALRECPECNGCGYIELSSDFNDYEVDCRTCDGKGTIAKYLTPDCPECNGSGWRKTDYPFLGSYIDVVSLKRISVIPGVKLSFLSGGKDWGYFLFNGGGFDGVIMGMTA